jgi:tetratricopeptide (TPR) repeat protein
MFCLEIAMAFAHLARMKTMPTILISLAIATTVLSPVRVIAAEGGEERYRACVDMIERSPDKAINLALEWQASDGGVPARHCEALALAHLEEYAESAARLMRIAEDIRIGKGMPVKGDKRLVANGALIADMYGQAANAWLLADEIVRAEDAIELALAVVPEGTAQQRELLVDRARIAAADQDYEYALADLEAVLKADEEREDILILIAAAARGVGEFDRAEEALMKYRSAYPSDTAVQLELGNLRYAQGRFDEARQAWLDLLLSAEEGPNAEAARANLEKLDVKMDEKPEG